MEWTRLRIAAVVVVGVLVVGVLGGLAYFQFGYSADEAAVAAVDEDERVTVEQTDAGYVVRSGEITASTTGVVLYPGARVDPESYVPTAADVVVEADVVVVIPEMPLNLAILSTDRADRAIDAYPAVDRWYVGGHSLGGAAACRYANADPERVDGLVLLASYCDQDVSGTDLRVLSVLGTADEVIDREAEREGRALLPPDARIVEVEGMTHAQFGAYGPQRGDGDPGIDDRAARQRVASELLAWLDAASADDQAERDPVPGATRPVAAPGATPPDGS